MMNFRTFVLKCGSSHWCKHARLINKLSVQTDTKIIGTTKETQRNIISKKPIQPENPRTLKVSIIGLPNAGKSTLANHLIGWRFASVSKKVHTTRNNAVGILTDDNTQVIFLDTPGLTTNEKVKKHKLEKSLLLDPYSSLFDTDLIIAVVDVGPIWNRSALDPQLLAALTLHDDKKSILVLNKVDLVRTKRDLLTATRILTEGMVGGKKSPYHKDLRPSQHKVDILDKILQREEQKMYNDNLSQKSSDQKTRQEESNLFVRESVNLQDSDTWWAQYSTRLKSIQRQIGGIKGFDKFEKVFMVSAVDGDGVDEIKQHLIDAAKPGPWLYNKAMVTDQDPIVIAKLCVREKLLDHLPLEIPYRINLVVTLWEYDENNLLRIQINLVCQRRRDVVNVIGQSGNIINKIREEAKQDLMNTFKEELSLVLCVQKPNSEINKIQT